MQAGKSTHDRWVLCHEDLLADVRQLEVVSADLPPSAVRDTLAAHGTSYNLMPEADT